LYYNPYEESKEITFNNSGTVNVDLFDIISGIRVAENILTTGVFLIPPDAARLIIVIPAGSEIEYKEGRGLINGKSAFYL
jgi:hypothetical protein